MNQNQLEVWLAEYVAKLLRGRRADVDVDMPFRQYGLDSTAVVGLSADLSDLLGVDLADDVAHRYKTIRLLAAHLAALVTKQGGPAR